MKRVMASILSAGLTPCLHNRDPHTDRLTVCRFAVLHEMIQYCVMDVKNIVAIADVERCDPKPGRRVRVLREDVQQSE